MSDKVDQQTQFLNNLIANHTAISAYLMNGVRLTGYITRHDKYVLFIEKGRVEQMVYKHSVSTIVPE